MTGAEVDFSEKKVKIQLAVVFVKLETDCAEISFRGKKGSYLYPKRSVIVWTASIENRRIYRLV